MPGNEDSERQRASAMIAEALSGEGAGTGAISLEAKGIADPKQFFCDNWDLVRNVLAVLREFAPAFLKTLIDLVIKGGDALKKAICR